MQEKMSSTQVPGAAARTKLTELVQDMGALSATEKNPPTHLSSLAPSSSQVQSSLLTVTAGDHPSADSTPKTPPLSSPFSWTSSCEDKPTNADEDVGFDVGSRVGTRSTDIAHQLHHITVKPLGEQSEGPSLSSPEIKTIMDQFDGKNAMIPLEGSLIGSTAEMSTDGMLRDLPRSSSLEPLGPSLASGRTLMESDRGLASPKLSKLAAKPSTGAGASLDKSPVSHQIATGTSGARESQHNMQLPGRPPSLQKALPPEPDPEPDLPFDFHRFLEQLRHRSADPVARFLRSFLVEFGKKQWMVHEQAKIISDFLSFITNKMAQCEVWQGVSDAEFDNAREGMEKLVMNRLYSQTFSPAIPPPSSSPLEKGKRRPGEKGAGPGRRGQHQEDVERDAILAQKISIYQWVREEHLDLKPSGQSGRRFLNLAQLGEHIITTTFKQTNVDRFTELSKIRSYRAPRDKVICVLNCCKVIFGDHP